LFSNLKHQLNAKKTIDLGNLTKIELRTLTPNLPLKISQTSPLPKLHIVKNGVSFLELKFCCQSFPLCDRGPTHAIVKNNFLLDSHTRSHSTAREFLSFLLHTMQMRLNPRICIVLLANSFVIAYLPMRSRTFSRNHVEGNQTVHQKNFSKLLRPKFDPLTIQNSPEALGTSTK